MNVRDAIHGRRTVHAYTRDPIPEGAVERAIEAAIQAPNHRLTFPWRFVVVGPEARARLADVAVELKTRPDAPMAPEQAQRVRAKILDPAELIVVSIVRHQDPAIAREDYASAACAIQNAMLTFHAEGVATKWSTGKVMSDARTYRALGIDPAAEEIVAFLWAGVAATVPAKCERPALEQLLRRVG